MRKCTELNTNDFNEILNDFYSYFETGYAFEEFLKVYLERIGLDEVRVTQRSSDGGVDLEAVRYGIGGLEGDIPVEYYVQAKRYKPNTTIPIEKIRALRGVMKPGSKGVFITTASYSVKTKEFVKNDLSRPIILIDGKSLIETCIDKEIGFVYKPVFSKDEMDALKSTISDKFISNNNLDDNSDFIAFVEKQITTNDIRARILRMPKALIDVLKTDQKTIQVSVNGDNARYYNIDKNRCYLAGVSDLYRKYGLIRLDGSYNPKKSIWKIYSDKVYIVLKEND